MQGRTRITGPSPHGGFTLVEVIITIAIIGVLFALLLPALAGVRTRARSFRCQVTLRSLAFDFSVFADEQLQGSRGDDDRLGDRFRLETFQESLYRVDEFWAWGDDRVHILPDTEGNDPLRCSEVSGPITLRRNSPCSGGAVGPPDNISYGFNSRLHRAETTDARGRPRTVPVELTADLLNEPMIPLVWDVDGQAARLKGSNPVFSAPSLGSRGPYAADRYWYPSARHGMTNVAFVGGHVLSSREPLAETGWLWDYQTVR